MIEGSLMLAMLVAVFLMVRQARELTKKGGGQPMRLFDFYENLDHKALLKKNKKKGRFNA